MAIGAISVYSDMFNMGSTEELRIAISMQLSKAKAKIRNSIF
jgi:hypothetical protein